MKYLLDTNVISELRKGARAHSGVVGWARSIHAADLGTSVVVLGEIRRGIERKRLRDPAQAAALDDWYATIRRRLGDRVVGVDEDIAIAWGRITAAPHPPPPVDAMLAATAIVRGLILVTRNLADVQRAGVAVLDPFRR